MMSMANRSARLLAQTRAVRTVKKWEEALQKDATLSTVASIRKRYGTFVDKTSGLATLVTEYLDKVHIAAPRRFGKSSTMKMVADLYRKNAAALFADTNIGRSTFFQDWKPHPFAIFDFSVCKSSSKLESHVCAQIAEWAAIYGVVIGATNISIQMTELLEGIYKNTRMPVVVLIDEYDIPTRTADPACYDILSDFYGAIKSCTVLRQMIMFGTFNTFGSIGTCTNDTMDLSEDSQTLALLGFTQEEVDALFENKIENADYYCEFASSVPGVNKANTVETNRELVLGKLKAYYNGFRLSERGPSVYNPYSVMQARQLAFIKPYFATTEILSEMKDLVLQFPSMTVGKPRIWMHWGNAFIEGKMLSLEKSTTVKRLWNLGLLTLERYEHPTYHLMVSNEEVKEAIQGIINGTLATTYGNQNVFNRIYQYAAAGDFTAMAAALIEAIPKEHSRFLHGENDLKYYLKLGLDRMCRTVKTEVKGVDNKMYNIRLEAGNKIFVFELKYERESAKDAMQQIEDKKYCVNELNSYPQAEVYAVALAYLIFAPTEVLIKRATFKPAVSDSKEREVDLQQVYPTK